MASPPPMQVSSHQKMDEPPQTSLDSNTGQMDLFAEALNLEDTAYEKGYAEGSAAGERAGRIEGRLFGLTHGYDRFVELGRLQGRAELWSRRYQPEPSSSATQRTSKPESNSRIVKHIDTLLELTDPEHSPSINTEEAVEAFEDRLKRAEAKTKLVEKILGEQVEAEVKAEQRPDTGVRLVRAQDAGRERNIEDL